MAIIKTEALYKQVANEMRGSITSGVWGPGAKIPPEEQLSATYAVSRPTVRQAVAALRTEGLLDAHQGRGTFVRDRTATPQVAMDRYISRTGARYSAGSPQWTSHGKPTATQLRIDADTAALLAIPEGASGYKVEGLLLHEASGTLALHRIVVPVESVTGTPLAKGVPVTAAKAYAILTTAHGDLQWRETVGARMPQPDERTTLQLAEGVPLLISQRLTLTQTDHRPLILETTSLSADRAQFAYAVEAQAKTSAAPKAKPQG
jgi:GntR family transcriptional regulator